MFVNGDVIFNTSRRRKEAVCGVLFGENFRLVTSAATKPVIFNPPLLPMPDVPFAVTKPSARRDFLLREKLNPFFTLHVEVAEE